MRSVSRIAQSPGLTACLFLAVALTGSCSGELHRGSARLQIRVDVEPAAPTVGAARITSHVSDEAWAPRNGLKVTVSGSHSDAPTVFVPAPGEGAGRYVAEAFSFSVPGRWVVTVRAELPDGRWTERDQIISVKPAGT